MLIVLASAACHSSCISGAGCFGPSNADLCGICYQTASINSCHEVDAPETVSQTCVTLWPPTELPFSAIFGLVVGFGCTLLLIIMVAILFIVYKVRKRYRDQSEGSYSIHVRSSNIFTLCSFLL